MILHRLAVVSPRPYAPWIAWEALTAGDRALGRQLLERVGRDRHPIADASNALLEMLDGGPARAPTHAIVGAEAAVAHALVTGEVARAPAALGWITGESAQAPFRLEAMGSAEAESRADVLVSPHDEARRVLSLPQRATPRCGAGLPRVQSLVSVLALAPSAGLTIAEAFLQSYGFAYRERAYGGTFASLLHRTREALEPFGEIERRGDVLNLSPRVAFVVSDPRCAVTKEERVLAALVQHAGALSARDVAGATGLPLRTTQVMLQRLVETEACLRARDGRDVLYRVEDTTFLEPTRF